jgi:hypothetical protein
MVHVGLPHWQNFMLYPCKPIRAEAAVYFNAGRNSACAKASANTEHVNKPHATQRLRQTHFFELVCIERYTAKPETTKKMKSTARHHVGAPLQQVLEQA